MEELIEREEEWYDVEKCEGSRILKLMQLRPGLLQALALAVDFS